ncbi:phage terminase small subunit P27 family [Sinorhizobium medicae]|nr:phage terminase small subunit P27 family [Sinorhizobium medicae]MDX1218521.1 phage terminase small subunit P27 family [Sinorhizobium medicae]
MAGKAGRSGRPTKQDAEQKRQQAAWKRAQKAAGIGSDIRVLGNLEPPEWFDPPMQELWWKAWESLHETGQTQFDMAALELFVVSWHQAREAAKLIAKTGMLVRDRDGAPRKNPSFVIQNQALMAFDRLGRTLGLDPKSRRKLFSGGNEEPDWMGRLMLASPETYGGGEPH